MQKQIFLEVSFQGSANDSLFAADSIALRQSHGGAIGNETTITLVLVMVTTDSTLTVVVIVVQRINKNRAPANQDPKMLAF